MVLYHHKAGFHTVIFELKVKLTTMKANISILFLLLFSPLATLLGQQNFQLLSAEMSIEGTSTLHDWVSTVSQFTADAEIEISNNKLVAIPKLQVRIPVKGIKSTKGRIMDNKTYDALKADDYATILFKLNKMTLQGANELLATGELKVAGHAKAIEFPVKYAVRSTGQIEFTGAYTLKMTDYKMDPPTALMGSIKTGDEVTVRFACVLEPVGSSTKTK